MEFGTFDFNYFDAVISAIVVILGIKGMINGFAKEFFGLLGLVGGVYIASRTAGTAGSFISEHFYRMESGAAIQLVGFITVLAIVWIAAVIAGSLLSSLTQASGLGPINRLLGFLVGGGKYFIIFALIVTALSNVTLVKENLGKYVDSSMLYPYLLKTGSYLINLSPDTFSSKEDNASTGSGVMSASSLKKSLDQSLQELGTDQNSTPGQ